MADAPKVASWLKQQLEAVYQEYLTWPEWRKREIEAEWLKTPLRVMTEKEKEEQRRSLNMMTEPTKEALELVRRIRSKNFTGPHNHYSETRNEVAAAIDVLVAQRVAEAEMRTIERCARLADERAREAGTLLEDEELSDLDREELPTAAREADIIAKLIRALSDGPRR